jgi:hypothetical protein
LAKETLACRFPASLRVPPLGWKASCLSHSSPTNYTLQATGHYTQSSAVKRKQLQGMDTEFYWELTDNGAAKVKGSETAAKRQSNPLFSVYSVFSVVASSPSFVGKISTSPFLYPRKKPVRLSLVSGKNPPPNEL